MVSVLYCEFLEDKDYSLCVLSAYPVPSVYGFPSVNKYLSCGMDLKLFPMWIALFSSGSNLAMSLFQNHQQYPHYPKFSAGRPLPGPAPFSETCSLRPCVCGRQEL